MALIGDSTEASRAIRLVDDEGHEDDMLRGSLQTPFYRIISGLPDSPCNEQQRA